MITYSEYRSKLVTVPTLIALVNMPGSSEIVRESHHEQLTELLNDLRLYHEAKGIMPLNKNDVQNLLAGVSAAFTVLHMLDTVVPLAATVGEITFPVVDIIRQLRDLIGDLEKMKEIAKP